MALFVIVISTYIVILSVAVCEGPNFSNLTKVSAGPEESEDVDFISPVIDVENGNLSSAFERQIYFPGEGGKGWSPGWTPPGKNRNKYGHKGLNATDFE